VTPSYLPASRYGGPIVSVHGLAKAQVEMGFEVDVCTTSVDGPSNSRVPHGVRVDLDGVGIYYFASKYFRRFYYSSHMGRYLSRIVKNYDICHNHSIYLWPSWKASRLAKRSGVPVVISPRGMLVPELIAARNSFIKSAWIRVVERRNFKRAAGIHFTSDLEADAARYYLPASLKRQAIIPNGVESEAEINHTPGFAKRDVALYLGRINWKKNIGDLINSIACLENLKLIVAGPADQDELDKLNMLVRERNLGHRVTFCGAVDSQQKGKLLARAKALVLCSVNENFGNVVVEALAAGCPVVVNESVGAAALVKRHDAGVVIEADNLSLTDAITRLCYDQTAWQRYHSNGLKMVKENLLWPHIATQFTAFYESLIK
jgi:glycosyltransferase involved in cell wall biosynthesis